METGLKVKIGADTSELTKGFDQAVAAMGELTKGIKLLTTTLSNFKGFNTISKDAGVASQALEQISTRTAPVVQAIGNMRTELSKPFAQSISQTLGEVDSSLSSATTHAAQSLPVFNTLKTTLDGIGGTGIVSLNNALGDTKTRIDAIKTFPSLSTPLDQSTASVNRLTAAVATFGGGVGAFKVPDFNILPPGPNFQNTVRSFDDVKASIFQAADAFNSKWNAVVNQAEQEANQATTAIGSLNAQVKAFGNGVSTFKVPDLTVKATVVPNLKPITQSSNEVAKALSEMNKAAMSNTGLQVAADGVMRFSKNTEQLESQLKRFQTGLKTATDPASITRLNSAITATKTRIDAIKNFSGVGDGLGSIKKGSDQAGNALMNLGRIAQDAPFGFIGISNNISPLLESFDRLKASTGSTKGALQALISGLSGGAGLGLAVSVATGLLTVFSGEIAKVVSGFFAVSKSVQAAKAAHANLVEVMNKGAEASAREIVNLRVLETVATDVNKPMALRKKAVDDLQEAYPKYLGNIKDEAILNGKAAVQINLVADALQKRAFAEAASSKAAEIAGKQLDLQLRRNFLLNREKEEKNNLIKAENEHLSALQKSGSQAEKNALVASGVGKAQQELFRINTALKENSDKYKRNSDQIKFFTDTAAENFKSVTKLDIDPTGKKAKDGKTLADVYADLQKQLATIGGLQSIGRVTFDKADIDRVSAYNKALEEMLNLGAKPTTPIVQQVSFELKPVEARVDQRILQEAIDNAKQIAMQPIEVDAPVEVVPILKPFDLSTLNIRDQIIGRLQKLGVNKLTNGLGIVIPISVANDTELDTKLKESEDKFRSFTQNIASMNQSLAAVVNNTLNEAFAGIGVLLAEALGGGDVGAAFKGLLSIVTEGIIQLGKSMIALGTAKEVLEKFNIAPGIGTLVAGIATVAIGTLLKGALPKFALGTMTTGATAAIIGDNPSGREYVTPSESIGRLAREINSQGGGGGALVVEHMISGQDLRLLISRAEKSFGRGY